MKGWTLLRYLKNKLPLLIDYNQVMFALIANQYLGSVTPDR